MTRSPRKLAPGSALRATLRQLLREASRAVDSFHRDPAGQAHFLRTRVKRLQSLCRLVPDGGAWLYVLSGAGVLKTHKHN